MRSRCATTRMRLLVLGSVVAVLLSVSAVASASTKGFVVHNDSGWTLKLAAVDPYGGVCRTQDCFAGGRPKLGAELNPGASQRWELYAPFSGRTGAFLDYDVMAGSQKVGTDRITVAYEFDFDAGMYSDCRETSSKTLCRADGWTRSSNEVTFFDPPGTCHIVKDPTVEEHTRCANADFGGTDADHLGAQLDHRDLSYADLHGANLYYGSVMFSNLQDANLRGADLTAFYGWSANFDHADLRGADLRGSSFYDARLRNADLSGANLAATDYPFGTQLDDADLTGANLRGANLIGVQMPGVNLTDANLAGADLFAPDLRGTVFCHTTMPDGSVRNDGCPKASGPPSSTSLACRFGSDRAQKNAGCLRAGQLCARSAARKYRRHGYACVLVEGRYRLLHRCASGSTLAVLGGQPGCLTPGAPCAPAHARQYRRHGYACVHRRGKYRLIRRPSTARMDSAQRLHGRGVSRLRTHR